MTTKLLPLAICCALAVACSKEAPPAATPAPKAAPPEAARPMPPAAPTAAPAEGEKHDAAKKDEPKK